MSEITDKLRDDEANSFGGLYCPKRALLLEAADYIDTLEALLAETADNYQRAHERAAENLRLATALEAREAELRKALSRDPDRFVIRSNAIEQAYFALVALTPKDD